MLPKHKGWHKDYNAECNRIISEAKQNISETNPDHGKQFHRSG